ncbi:TPA: hypothetical protein DDW35_03910 [Candidatus Sumerlaeota bacterium]|jgi:predicted Zn-dependent protease|nr:hypothetical protein [Candidatus Sumerlaeota bacterium]
MPRLSVCLMVVWMFLQSLAFAEEGMMIISDPEQQQAIARAKQVLVLDTVQQRANVQVVFSCADLLVSKGDKKEAARFYLEGLKVDSWNFEYQLKAARLLKELNRKTEAVERLNAILKREEGASEKAPSAEIAAQAQALLAEIAPAGVLSAAPAVQLDAITTAPLSNVKMTIVPIGNVNEVHIRAVAARIQAMTGVNLRYEGPILNPGNADRTQGDIMLEDMINKIQGRVAPQAMDAMLAQAHMQRSDLTTSAKRKEFILAFFQIGKAPAKIVQDFETKYAAAQKQQQYSTTRMLYWMKKLRPLPQEQGFAGFIGITDKDIFDGEKPEASNFLFSTSSETYALCSYHRFTWEFLQKPVDQTTQFKRTQNCLLWGVANLLHMPVCNNPGCARNYANDQAEADRSGSNWCPQCMKTLQEKIAIAEKSTN